MTKFNEKVPVNIEGMKANIHVSGAMQNNSPHINHADYGDLDLQLVLDNHIEITNQIHYYLNEKYGSQELNRYKGMLDFAEDQLNLMEEIIKPHIKWTPWNL